MLKSWSESRTFLLMDPGQRRSVFPDAEKAACSERLHPSGGTKREGMLPGQADGDIKFTERFRSLHFWVSLKKSDRNPRWDPKMNRLAYPGGGCLFFPRLSGEPRCRQPGGVKPTLPVPGKAACVSHPPTSCCSSTWVIPVLFAVQLGVDVRDSSGTFWCHYWRTE